MRSIQLIAFLFLFIACNNSANNRQTVKTRADSLMNDVMEDHNVGMGKMSRLNEARNEIQHRLDSIARLPYDLRKGTSRYKMQLDSAFNRLSVANDAMEQWMNQFNMDSDLNNTEQRIKYLESEKIKISEVKDAMIHSLQNADSLLRKR